MKSKKLLFLEKAFIGHSICDDSNAVIAKCISLAYNDMMTAGRFYLSGEKDKRCEQFKLILGKHNFIFSRSLIDETCSIFGDTEIIGHGNRYAARYGLSQKLVNMVFKYFFIFSDYTKLDIDFSSCDCPLDSIIIEKLSAIRYVWSKLTPTEYIECQNEISKKLKGENLDCEMSGIGNLAFDFLYW